MQFRGRGQSGEPSHDPATHDDDTQQPDHLVQPDEHAPNAQTHTDHDPLVTEHQHDQLPLFGGEGTHAPPALQDQDIPPDATTFGVGSGSTQHIDSWMTMGDVVVEESYIISSQGSEQGPATIASSDVNDTTRTWTSTLTTNDMPSTSIPVTDLAGHIPLDDMPTMDHISDTDSSATLMLGGNQAEPIHIIASQDTDPQDAMVDQHPHDDEVIDVDEESIPDTEMDDQVEPEYEHGEEEVPESDESETLGSEDTSYYRDPSGVIFGRRGDYVFISSDPRKRKDRA